MALGRVGATSNASEPGGLGREEPAGGLGRDAAAGASAASEPAGPAAGGPRGGYRGGRVMARTSRTRSSSSSLILPSATYPRSITTWRIVLRSASDCLATLAASS